MGKNKGGEGGSSRLQRNFLIQYLPLFNPRTCYPATAPATAPVTADGQTVYHNAPPFGQHEQEIET